MEVVDRFAEKALGGWSLLSVSSPPDTKKSCRSDMKIDCNDMMYTCYGEQVC